MPPPPPPASFPSLCADRRKAMVALTVAAPRSVGPYLCREVVGRNYHIGQVCTCVRACVYVYGSTSSVSLSAVVSMRILLATLLLRRMAITSFCRPLSNAHNRSHFSDWTYWRCLLRAHGSSRKA